jgi:gliding motility-associated lipoprotein GldH
MCAIGLIMCIQCTNKHKAQLDFPKNRWYQSDILSLKFDSSSLKDQSSISFNISYVHGFQFSEIPLEMYITSPLHQIDKIPFTLQLLDDDSNELGDCVGDYCDFKYTIKEQYEFKEEGMYQIKVLNMFDHQYLPNVLSVAIELE